MIRDSRRNNGRAASWLIRVTAVFALALLRLLPGAAPNGPPVTTANSDNACTNSNLAETRLSPTTVSPSTFGKLYTLPVDGQVYAQPLYVPGVAVPNVKFSHWTRSWLLTDNSVRAYSRIRKS